MVASIMVESSAVFVVMNEDQLSEAVNNELIRLSIEGKFTGVFFHVANEVQPPGMKPWQAKRFWEKREKMGITKGAPDWVFAWYDGYGFIELKKPATYKISEKTGRRIIDKPKGTMSHEQKDFKSHCEGEGIPYEVCYSVDDVLACLHKWKAIAIF